MRVIIEDNYDFICYWVATYIKLQINNHNMNHNHDMNHNHNMKKKEFVLGLPTGSTPMNVYKYLIQFYKNKELSFKNVVTFNMDEYVGLASDDTNSYSYFMYSNFFNHIDIPLNNINLLNGLAEDLQQECKRYEETIEKYGGIDLFLCGIGSDGHIAFNEPGSSLKSKTRIKTLSLETIQDNARFFPNIGSVPKQALTIGIQTVFAAEQVIIMSSGVKKAIATKECLEGPISSQYTCSYFQTHPHTIMVCDEEAIREIKYKNYLYHKFVKNNTDIIGNPVIDYINKYISPEDKVLITSPHPDDDVIGMGGTMDLLPNKQNVSICYMTNGIGGLKNEDECHMELNGIKITEKGVNVNELRIKEAISSVKVLGYEQEQVINAKLPFYFTNEREITKEDMNEMSAIIDNVEPQHIFICVDPDPKKTHIKCAQILQKCKYNTSSLKKIWLYKSAWDNWDKEEEEKKEQNQASSNLISNQIPKLNFYNKLLAIDMHISQMNPMVVYSEKINSFKDIVCIQNKSEKFIGHFEERFKIITSVDEFSSLSF